ncbi:hypothetical protein [Desulforamulus reducens]|nr:hypothetical protein [Desulforamulus reducens]
MVKENNRLSGTKMLLLGSLYVAAPLVGFLMGRKDSEERKERY